MATYKKVLVVLLTMILLVTVGCSSGNSSSSNTSSNEVQHLALTTAGTGGGFYVFGAALSKVVNNNEPTLNITAQSSGGSVENVRLLNNNEVAFALLGGDTAIEASQGIGQFEEKGNFSGMFSMYSQPLNVVALANSGINSIEDLKGRKVSVGEPGSGTEKKNQSFMNVLGVPFEDFSPQLITVGEGEEALRDDAIEAIMEWSGIPVPSILNLSTSRDIKLITFTDEQAQAVQAEIPYIFKMTIPGGTYEGVVEDVQTLGVNTQAVVRNDIPEEVVYKFVKAVFENLDVMHASIESAKEMTPESAVKNVIPLHPGAEKYFKEIGVLD